jgi:hypothetical protein
MNANFSIIKDVVADTILSGTSSTLPIIDSPTFPPNQISGKGGGLLYNRYTAQVYYNTGATWLPISSGSSSGILSFSFVKNNNLVIPPSTNVTIAGLSDSPPYTDNTGAWNLSTGVYTSFGIEVVNIVGSISWLSGINNYGSRIARIIYKPSAGSPTVISESHIQPSADSDITTSQVVIGTMLMSIGDQAWVQVFQDSPDELVVSEGPGTTILGYRSAT